MPLSGGASGIPPSRAPDQGCLALPHRPSVLFHSQQQLMPQTQESSWTEASPSLHAAQRAELPVLSARYSERDDFSLFWPLTFKHPSLLPGQLGPPTPLLLPPVHSLHSSQNGLLKMGIGLL